MKEVFIAQIIDGKPKFQNQKALDQFYTEFESKWMQFTIERRKKKRSPEQNNYWAVMVKQIRLALKEQGFQNYRDDASVRELLRYKFLLVDEYNEKTGEVLKRMKSTSELSTTEMMELWEEVMQWASEFLGIFIPNPRKDWKLFKETEKEL